MTCVPPQNPTPGEPGRASRSAIATLGGLLLLCVAGPVAGDIGSCGQPLEELDPAKFFAEKQRVDCEQCGHCELDTHTCAEACAGGEPTTDFPAGCFPLAQDGEVCLRALRAAGCDEYARYVDDAAPETPTECNFCPPGERPEGR